VRDAVCGAEAIERAAALQLEDVTCLPRAVAAFVMLREAGDMVSLASPNELLRPAHPCVPEMFRT